MAGGGCYNGKRPLIRSCYGSLDAIKHVLNAPTSKNIVVIEPSKKHETPLLVVIIFNEIEQLVLAFLHPVVIAVHAF